MNFTKLFKFEQVDAGGAGAGAAGAGTPPPAAPAAGASAAGSGQFYESFPQDLKDYTIQKGFKDPAAIVDAYRNFEKMKGVPQERLLTLPEKADDKAAWDQIYERLGKPKDGNYSFEKKPDATGKDTFGEWASDAFKNANLTDAQAKALVESYRAKTENITKDVTETFQNKLKQEHEALQKEWGNAFEQNKQIAQIAAQNLGVKKEVVEAMEKQIGTAETLKFFKTLGDKIGEGKFREGDSKSVFGKMDPETARAQLAAYKQDRAFMQKYGNKDAEAVKIMTQLFADAYPGEQNL